MMAKRLIQNHRIRIFHPSWSSAAHFGRFLHAAVDEDDDAGIFYPVDDAAAAFRSRRGGPPCSNDGSATGTTSLRVQQQVALQKLPEMTQMIQSLSQTPWRREKEPRTPVLRQAVQYWLSKPTKSVVGGTERQRWAIHNALDLVLWTKQNRSSELLSVADIPTLTRLVRYLVVVPRNSSVPYRLDSLYQASQVVQLMMEEVAKTKNRSYEESCLQALTMLWNRRIQFMTRNQHKPVGWRNDERTRVALGEMVDATDYLEELHRLCAQSIQMFPNNGLIALSLLSSFAHMGAADEAKSLLMQLEQHQTSATANSATELLKLSTRHYNAVLIAYRNQSTVSTGTGERDACREGAWQFWKDHIFQNPDLNPYHPITMTVLLDILAQASPQRAQDFLATIPDASATHYNVVLTGWAKSRQSEASNGALAVLQMMESRQVVPDHISYTAVMEALLQSNDLSALDQVDELLRQYQSSSAVMERTTTHSGPDLGMYIVVLRGLQRFQLRHVESQVREDVCRRMDVVLDQMRKAGLANVSSYNLVLDAWSRSHSTLAASSAMKHLDHMEAHSIVPNVETIQFAMKCLSIKVVDPKQTKEHAEAALQLLKKHQLQESSEVFENYLRVLTRTGNVEDAQRLVMERLEQGETPDEMCYFLLVEGYAKLPNGANLADDLLKKWHGTPSLQMISAVMMSWSYCSTDSAFSNQRIDELWQQALRFYGKTLTSYFYGAYMKALKNRLNAPLLMEKLLLRMQEDYESGNRLAKPNASIFSTVIVAWADCKIEGGADRAEAILDQLEELHRYNVELKPTIECYRGVLRGWAYSRDLEHCGERALALLDRLEQHSSLLPNRSCFHYTIKAVGRSNAEDKAATVFQLLQRQNRSYASGNRHARPSIVEYISAIRAIGSSKGTMEARYKAYEVLEKVLVDWRNAFPNPSLKDQEDLYLQYLWAAFKLLNADASRDYIVIREIQDCPLQLLVQQNIRKAVTNVISRTAYYALVERKKSGAP